jgi:competence ComEA-like helix-hairpin-helix protein
VLAAGLILGGAVSMTARHFDLDLTGLLSPVSERDLVSDALAAASLDEPLPPESPDPSAPEVATGLEPPAPVAGRAGAPEVARGRRLGPIDINRAGAKQLEALDGVGPALAGRIVELRVRKGGRFHSMRELLEVRGIGPATLERIAASATLGPTEAAPQKTAFRKSTSSQADSSAFQR